MPLQGELWRLPADHVRKGHPAEREGLGLLRPLEVRTQLNCLSLHMTDPQQDICALVRRLSHEH